MGTISKALGLLDWFSSDRPEIGLTEFQKLAGRDKATVYRHLFELTKNGFLEQNPATKEYRLGAALLRLASMRELTFPVHDALAPIVESISLELKELVHVSLLQGAFLLPIYNADISQQGLRVNLGNDASLPLHATASGFVVLAYGPEQLFKQISQESLETFTDQTPADRVQLARSLEQVQTNGFATVEEGFEAGVSSYAVPVFDRHQMAQGALACAFPTTRGTLQNRSKIIKTLCQAAPFATEKLGGVVPSELKLKWAVHF